MHHNPCRLRKASVGGSQGHGAGADRVDGGGGGSAAAAAPRRRLRSGWAKVIAVSSTVGLVVWLTAFKAPRIMSTSELRTSAPLATRRHHETSEMDQLNEEAVGYADAMAGGAEGFAAPAPAGAMPAAAVPAASQSKASGVAEHRWDNMFQVLQAVKASHAFQYVVLRNWENLPESAIRGSHGDIDVYVTSRVVFAKFIGCTYTGAALQQCWVRANDDGTLIHFDVHGPDDPIEYYPRAWGEAMLATRVVSTPAVESAAHGGVYRPSDVHYYYSLLYHLAYHGKTSVKPDYVPVLEGLKARLGATQPKDVQDLDGIKDAVDGFMRCRGYVSSKSSFRGNAPFVDSAPDCVQ